MVSEPPPISVGPPASRNLITGGPRELDGGFGTILEFVLRPNSTPQNPLVS